MPQSDKAALFSLALSALSLYTATYLILASTLLFVFCNALKLVLKRTAKSFALGQNKTMKGASHRQFPWLTVV